MDDKVKMIKNEVTKEIASYHSLLLKAQIRSTVIKVTGAFLLLMLFYVAILNPINVTRQPNKSVSPVSPK